MILDLYLGSFCLFPPIVAHHPLNKTIFYKYPFISAVNPPAPFELDPDPSIVVILIAPHDRILSHLLAHIGSVPHI